MKLNQNRRQPQARSALALTRCIIVENKKENKNVCEQVSLREDGV